MMESSTIGARGLWTTPVRLVLVTRVERVLAPALTLALLVAVWWLAVGLSGIPWYVVPAPPQVWNALTEHGWAYLPDVWTTVREVLAGFALGLIAGLVLAMVMALWSPFRVGLYPLLIFSQVVPVFVVAVVVTVIWSTYNLVPQIVVTALYSFLPLVVTGTLGFDRVDPDLVRLLRAAGASDFRIFRTVRFPSALPAIFSGAKLAMVFAVGAAAFSEWIGGYSGLGYYMRVQNGEFMVPQVFAGALVLTILGAALFGAVALVERIAIPWSRSSESNAGEE